MNDRVPDQSERGVTANEPGHHTTEGRNVIPAGGGHGGTDIFHAAVQMSRMPTCLTDPHQHDDPIIFCNQAFERLTGYARDEIVGTLGSMASSLAHEFNNLMTIVLANLERLQGEVSSPRGRKSIEQASWDVARATRLTDQMLSFAKRQFHDDQVLDLNVTLSNCDTILDQMAGSNARVRLDLAPGPPLASLDASQLEMALLNLVRNAADADPSGCEITISTRACRAGEGTDHDVAEIAVQDHGCGMSPEVVQRATEPFFATKPLGKGTGLDLSMVKGFVEQSGGRFELASEVESGTTVRMMFPRIEDDRPG